MTDAFVSVVVPVRDDADILPGLIEDLSRVLRDHYAHYEVVLVDDGSVDGTAGRVAPLLAEYPSMRLIRLSSSFGTETAILAGMESVIGDYVAVMMPDSDPPEMIPNMVDLAVAGAGIVSGVRMTRGDIGPLMRLLAPLFYWYCNRVLRLAIPRNTTELRVLGRSVVDAVIRAKDLLRFQRMYSIYAACKSATVAYEPGSRRGKPRRRSRTEVLRRSFGIIIANSTHPLRVLSILGLVVSGLSLLYSAYVLLTYVFGSDVTPGWVTQSVQSSIMFFFLFLTQAVLCEYVGRLLEERGNRPWYHVIEEISSKVMVDETVRRNVVGNAGDERHR